MNDPRPHIPTPDAGANLSARLRLGMLALAALFLSPMLLAGLYFDDLYYAVAYQGIGAGVLTTAGDEVQRWWGNGRFFPINVLAVELVFRVVDHDSRPLYHAAQILAVGGCFVLFITRLARRLGASGRFFTIAGLLLLFGVTAIRPVYHDPFVSYHFQQPLFFVCFFLSVLCLDRHLRDARGVGYLAASLLLYLLAIGIYEIAYPLILVFFVMIAARRPRALRLWATYGLLFTALVGFQLYLRQNASDETYQGTAMSVSPAAMLSAFVNQVYCVTPLSWITGRVVNKAIDVAGLPQLRLVFDLGFVLLLLGLGVWLVRRVIRSGSDAGYLALIGLLMWVLPAIPIALSAKYQAELSLTTGYLPRFVQGFGLVMLLLPLLIGVRRRAAVLVSLGLLALAVFGHNVVGIRESNEKYRAAHFIYAVLGDDAFLADTQTTRLFVRDCFVYEPQAYRSINDSVPLIHKDPGQLKPGDKTLILHETPEGDEFGYWGTWQSDGLVHGLHAIVASRASAAIGNTAYMVDGYHLVPTADPRPLDELIAETN